MARMTPPSQPRGLSDAVNLLNAISDPKQSSELLAPLLEYTAKCEEYFSGIVEFEKLQEYIESETRRIAEQGAKISRATQVLDQRTNEIQAERVKHEQLMAAEKEDLQASRDSLNEIAADLVTDRKDFEVKESELKAAYQTINSREAKLSEREREVEAKAKRITDAQAMLNG